MHNWKSTEGISPKNRDTHTEERTNLMYLDIATLKEKKESQKLRNLIGASKFWNPMESK